MRSLLISIVVAAAVAPIPCAASSDTGFDPRIVTFGEARRQIQSTPVLERPNRPLHVYGNTVRRRHHRGAAAAR